MVVVHGQPQHVTYFFLNIILLFDVFSVSFSRNISLDLLLGGGRGGIII